MRERRTLMDCTEVAELVPELALGLLDGAERAAVLGHVDGCGRCQADLAGLTEVGENLLLLTPEAEPPPGFESRVLDQVERGGDGRHGTGTRRARLLLAAAAAIVVLLLAGATVALLGRDGGGDEQAGDDPRGALASADMLNDEGDVVAVATYRDGQGDDPGTMALDMSDWVAELEDRGVPADAEWWLILLDTQGERHRYPLPVTPTAEILLVHGPTASEATTAAITTGDGRTLCQGTFQQLS